MVAAVLETTFLLSVRTLAHVVSNYASGANWEIVCKTSKKKFAMPQRPAFKKYPKIWSSDSYKTSLTGRFHTTNFHPPYRRFNNMLEPSTVTKPVSAVSLSPYYFTDVLWLSIGWQSYSCQLVYRIGPWNVAYPCFRTLERSWARRRV